MVEQLTRAEIETRYPDQWVLVGDLQTNEFLEIQGGRVLYHSRDRDEVYRQVVALRPPRYTVLYTGQPPEGMEFIL